MLWCLSQSNGFVDHAVVRQLRKSVYLFSSRICVKEHDRETVLGLRELTLFDRHVAQSCQEVCSQTRKVSTGYRTWTCLTQRLHRCGECFHYAPGTFEPVAKRTAVCVHCFRLRFAQQLEVL